MEEFNYKEMKELLSKTGHITNRHDKIDYETGKRFNIFEIVDINTDERKVCRVLRELLDPKGRHGQGSIYLEIFLKNCLRLDFSKTAILAAEVGYEDGANGRSIDITIRIDYYFIPMEVKINAADGENQCYDYFMYAKKLNINTDRETKVVYLTKYGEFPSEKSVERSVKEKLRETDVICISWGKNIINWLEKCLEVPGTYGKESICEILNQLINTIKHFTYQVEDDFMNEMTKLLKSPEDMRNVENILIASNKRKAEMTIRLFNAIEKSVNKEVVSFGNRDQDIRNYYTTNKNHWAKIQFLFKRIKHDTNILFVIELYYNDLVAGLLIAGERGHNGWTLSKEESRKFGLYQRNNNNWSNKFQPLLRSNSAGFRDHNDAFYNLFDEAFFDDYVKKCVMQVEQLWTQWENEIKECEEIFKQSNNEITD